MESIVLELQKEALDRNCSVSDLLRRALVVAKKLKLAEFERWVGNELTGYNGPLDEVPEYRVLLGQVKARNQVHGWIPAAFDNDEQANLFSRRPCGQSVAELEHLIAGKERSSTLMMQFPPEIESLLMEMMDRPRQVMLHIPSSSFAGILDMVRNTVLNWALQLEADGILGTGLSFTKQEQARASELAHSINNFYGPVSQSQFAQGAENPIQLVAASAVNVDEIKAIIAKVKEAADEVDLAPEQASELRADLATVESQVQSPKPKRAIIKQSLASIRTILEGASGNVIGAMIPELVAKIAKWLAGS